ncbi:hypothetical protein L6452_27430 [Arctium lappa]|uniref:Uncharacterized protein n=1 Tax=Arctium lappa TaxID=4217 RepID=A0ACB9A0L7_ARCLA|nr:hypothetical protein L6452_27430 [Arctium lappa]
MLLPFLYNPPSAKTIPVILRVLPDIAIRSRHLSRQSLPLFRVKSILLNPLLRKKFSYVSASTTEPIVSNLPITGGSKYPEYQKKRLHCKGNIQEE